MWCASCSNGLCIQCSSGYLLVNSYCIASCPVGYYHNNVNNTCDKCSPGCIDCSNVTCSDCHTTYFLDTTGVCKKCLTGCF